MAAPNPKAPRVGGLETIAESPPSASTESQGRETLERAREREDQRVEIHEREKRERAGMSLEMLDKRSRAAVINSLDIRKSPEIQPQKTDLLNFYVTYNVLPEILATGEITEEELRKFWGAPHLLESKIRSLQRSGKLPRWDSPREAAFTKLVEAAKLPKSPFSAKWNPTWESILETVIRNAKEAKVFRDTKPSTWERIKGFPGEIYTYVKSHKVETALIVAGTLGTIWLLKKIFGKKGEEKTAEAATQKSTVATWGKRLALGGMGVGAVWALSKIMPKDSPEKIKQWIAGFFKGDKKEQKETAERNTFYASIAPPIGIRDPELLTVMGEYEYGDFMSFTGGLKSEAKGKVKEFFADALWGNLSSVDSSLLPDAIKNFTKKRKEQPGVIRETEANLRAFFEKHTKTIETIYPRHTVKDVLEGLARKGVFGKEYQEKPWQISQEQVPVAVITAIETKYGPVEKNDVKQIAVQAFEHEEAQKRDTFGQKGLIRRLELMAQKDPSYRKKIEEVKSAYGNLERKRLALGQSLETKAPLTELQSRLSEIQDAEEEFNEISVSYYAETQGHVPAWGYLLYFTTRWQLMKGERGAVFREHVRRILTIPRDAQEAFLEGRDPVKFYEQKMKETETDRRMWEKKHGWNMSNEVHRNEAANDKGWIVRDRKYQYLSKKLKFEQRKFLRGLPPIKLASYQEELLRLECETVEAQLAYFHRSIDYLKNELERSGSKMSSRGKVEFMRDIQGEKRELRKVLQRYEGDVLRQAEKLGKNTDAAKKILKEADELINGPHGYRALVKEELSLWRAVIGESSGLRREFLDWVKTERNTGLVKFIKSPRGRIGIMGLLLIPSLYGEYHNIKEKNPEVEVLELWKELGPSAGQLLLDVCPLTFGVSDWYTLWTGKELVTRKKVTGWERGSRVIWGTLGALLDTATVIPGVNVVGAPSNAIMRAARAVGRLSEGKKLINMWPKIQAVAERVGGWKKFAQHLQNMRSATGKAKVGEALRAASIPMTRLAIGGTLIHTVYSLGDDVDSEGEELDPSLVEEVEKIAAGKILEEPIQKAP